MTAAFRVLLSLSKNGQTVVVSLSPIEAADAEAAGRKAVTLFDHDFIDRIQVLLTVLTHRSPDEEKRRFSHGM